MLKVHSRIEKLEKRLGLRDHKPFQHRIVFIDSDGSVDRQHLLISEGRMEWIDGDVPE